MLSGHCQYLLYVFGEPKLSESFVDMVGRNGFLCLFFCYLVGLGGYEGDELDATVDQKVARISCKGDARGSEDLGDDLLNGSYVFDVGI